MAGRRSGLVEGRHAVPVDVSNPRLYGRLASASTWRSGVLPGYAPTAHLVPQGVITTLNCGGIPTLTKALTTRAAKAMT